MNLLQNTSVVCRRAVFAFIIISSLAIAVSAQKSTQEGCKTYGCAGFVGEPINLKVVNADVRDILNYITEQYGINFVIDASVKATPVTVNVSEVPWNVALASILRSQGLAIEVNGNILRVADAKVIASEGVIRSAAQDNALDGQPLVTEFIRLNYARAANGFIRGSETAGTMVGGDVMAPAVGSAEGSAFGSTSNGPGSKTSGLLPIIQRRL